MEQVARAARWLGMGTGEAKLVAARSPHRAVDPTMAKIGWKLVHWNWCTETNYVVQLKFPASTSKFQIEIKQPKPTSYLQIIPD
jgi:hypothetical protein